MFLSLIFAFILTANSGVSSPPMQNGSTIAGNITDSTRRPIADIWVELLDEVDTRLRRVKTDGSGRYIFNGLSRGNYQVKVVTTGTNYVSQTHRIELVVISASAGSGRAYEDVSMTLKTVDEVKPGSKPGGAGTVFSQNVPPEAQKLYDEALEKLIAKNLDEGILTLKQAIDAFPNYYLAHERLGAEYVKLEKYTDAQEILAKALKINPKGQMSLHSLGVAQFKLKDLPAAVASLQQAVSLLPNSINSQFWLGIVLTRSRKYMEAETPLKRAFELGGKQLPADLHMYLAEVYSNTKRYKEAADELEMFLKETDAKDSERIKGLIKTLREKAGQ
jgi:cytochrome c-type biogenesis protein CcmH/NrfG